MTVAWTETTLEDALATLRAEVIAWQDAEVERLLHDMVAAGDLDPRDSGRAAAAIRREMAPVIEQHLARQEAAMRRAVGEPMH
jgi:hypothetical protein